ncbi:TlpA family protein disulfide reductase [Sinimarinibacterium thermocellulolyticum]|uniref:TlpA disulfide reductase family protein n=1 Tax=Sinimarinibacterium thermocellulolyticum TaxID=3170016 RepID=A0ABV2ABP0_9GAMM
MRAWLLLASALFTTTTTTAAMAADRPPAALQAILRAAEGRPVYVDFWASWCVPCALSFPWLNSVRHRYGGELVVVGVNVDQHRADADRFLMRHPAEFMLLFDPAGEIAAHYQLQGMPSAVLLDADGDVIWQHSGFRKDEIPEYEAAIRSALK